MNCIILFFILGLLYLVKASELSLPDHLVKCRIIEKQPTDLSQPKGLVLNTNSYPNTSGSTSAEPLGVWIASRILNKKCHWKPIIKNEEYRMLPLIEGKDFKLQKSIDRKFVTLDSLLTYHMAFGKIIDSSLYKKIQHYGTHGSYKKLINNEVDLIYECRKPSEDELKLMKRNGVELDIRPIALDAFIFIRNPQNPVQNLTLEQVQHIYTSQKMNRKQGIIYNWNQVGGPDHAIRQYIRNRNSGSQETFNRIIMKDLAIIKAQSMTTKMMGGPYNKMRNDKYGIGFTFFYYHKNMSPGSIENKILMFAINGVKPNRMTILNKKYPLVTEVYVVVRKNLKKDHLALKLRNWLLSDEGQKIIGETGYIPIESH